MKLEMENKREQFYQWDLDQKLIVEDSSCSEVHFATANMDNALVCEVKTENGVRVVDVPNILLQQAAPIYAYLYCLDGNGKYTRYARHFPVCKRLKPDSYVYTHTEVLNYNTLADRIEKVESLDQLVGLSHVIAQGTAQAVAPAYTPAIIADKLSLISGKSYTVKAEATGDQTLFSCFVRLKLEDNTDYLQTVVTDAKPTSSLTFTADSDYDNVSLVAECSVASGLFVTISLETTGSENLRVVTDRHETSIKETDNILAKAFAVVDAFDGVEAGKIYTEGFQNGASLALYDTYYKAVTAGESFLITSMLVPNFGYSVASFWNNEGRFIFGAGYYTEVGRQVTDYKVTAPPNAVLMRVVTYKDATPVVKKFKVEPISGQNEELIELVAQHEDSINRIDDVIDLAFQKIVPAAFDGVEAGKVYNKIFPNGASLNQYNTYYKAVSAGSIYMVTSTLVPNSQYSVASFWDEKGDYLSAAGCYDDVGAQVTDYEITIPQNAVLMRVVVKAESIPEIKTKEITPVNLHSEINKQRMTVSFENEVCRVQTPYNDNEMLVVEIKRGGGNNLPDIKSVYVTNNGVLLRTLVSSETDIFSPHIVKAVNNADGDNLNENGSYRENFTGGNHQYNNSGSGSTATARCGEFSVTDLGHEVVVKWTNYIQGYNTTKVDGSGREIMREDVRLDIANGMIYADIRHTALEDIVRQRYYGLQQENHRFDTIEFIGGADRLVHTAGGNSNSGNKECRMVRLTTSSGDVSEIVIEDIDLGNFAFNGTNYNAFDADYGKNYFNIINGVYLTQTKDQVTTTRGYYRFYHN